MMRSANHWAVACRAPNGQIVVETEPVIKTWIGRQQWLKLPFLRGTFALLDSMLLGHRAMHFAGEVQVQEKFQKPDYVPEPPKDFPLEWILAALVLCLGLVFLLPKDQSLFRILSMAGAALSVGALPPIRRLLGPVFEQYAIVIAMGVGLGLGFFIFDYIPQVCAEALSHRFHLSSLGTNYVAEFVKVGIFIGYLALIARVESIREVFRYHGAEHKAINALELDHRVNVPLSSAQTRLHPRCGTSFMVIVLFVSFLVLPLVPRYPLGKTGNVALDAFIRFVEVLLILPLIAGVSYELLKVAGKFRDQKWVNMAFAPGLFSQRVLTTVEPETPHVEVAVASLQAVMLAEKTGELTKTEDWNAMVKPADIEVLQSDDHAVSAASS